MYRLTPTLYYLDIYILWVAMGFIKSWLPNANKNETNKMKTTGPMRTQREPTLGLTPGAHFGLVMPSNANLGTRVGFPRLFGYQYVCTRIGNTKC